MVLDIVEEEEFIVELTGMNKTLVEKLSLAELDYLESIGVKSEVEIC